MDPCSKEKEIDKLLSCIYGNGEPGMKTTIAVISERVHKIPTSAQLKAYAFFGGIVGGIVSVVGSAFVRSM